MNVEQVIKALQDLIEEDQVHRYAAVVNPDYFTMNDAYLDSDENGDPVVVIE